MFDPKSGMSPAIKDDKGNPFIDRSPKTFEVILSYLRTGKFYPCEGISDKEIYDEGLFYGIDITDIEDHVDVETQTGLDVEKQLILLFHEPATRDTPNPKTSMYKL